MLFFRKRYINKIKSVIKSDNALILVGARQVWKSSLLAIMKDKWIVDNNIMLSWDELVLEDFNPESFLDYLKLKYNIVNKDFLIIDEAQKIKNIWLIIKYLVDQKKEWKINFKAIISGSWSLEIFRWITDSLIWRYNLIKVTPFSFEEFLEFNDVNISSIDLKNITKPVLNEIKKYYDLYIKYWWYPEVVKANTENDKKKKFKNIYNDYLYKDISFLLKWEDIINFEKFLKLFVSKIWSLIKIEQLMHELWIKKSQCEKYIKILKSSFLFDFIKSGTECFKIPKFSDW